jgi:hypothetical protein
MCRRNKNPRAAGFRAQLPAMLSVALKAACRRVQSGTGHGGVKEHILVVVLYAFMRYSLQMFTQSYSTRAFRFYLSELRSRTDTGKRADGEGSEARLGKGGLCLIVYHRSSRDAMYSNAGNNIVSWY